VAAACTETNTPTEVPAFVAPTPEPTPIPQPASMSGLVLSYGGDVAIPGATVECQGKSTTALNTGAYGLSSLMSGTTWVTVRWRDAREDTTQTFAVQLKPGPNHVDLRAGP